MMQIAVCDDNFQVRSQLEDYIRRRKEGRRLEVEIFDTGKEFEEALKKRYHDSIFPDIVMRDRNGIGLGRFIREELGNDTNTIVYMLTYGDEYALDLFQLQLFYLIKKLIRPEDLQNTFHKAREKIGGDAGTFEFKPSWTVHGVPLKDILYFEGDSQRVKAVTAGHTYHCYPALENPLFKINMDQAGSIRLHRSYTINLRYVITFSMRMVILFDGSELMVSVPFKENALR